MSTIAYPLATSDADRAGLGHGAAVGLLNGAWAGAMVAAPFAAGALLPLGRDARHVARDGRRSASLGAAWLLAREVRGARSAEPQPA